MKNRRTISAIFVALAIICFVIGLVSSASNRAGNWPEWLFGGLALYAAGMLVYE